MAEALGGTWIEPEPPPTPPAPALPPQRPAAVDDRQVRGQCVGKTRGRRCPYDAKERLGPVKLCRPHMDELLAELAKDVASQLPQCVAVTGSGAIPSDLPLSIVYYVGIRELQQVKIGTSGNPRSRLMELRRRWPGLVLLAHERGGSDVERLRHRQFRDLRVRSRPGREWFHRDETLMEHIAKVRAANPIADLTRVLPPSFPVASVRRSS